MDQQKFISKLAEIIDASNAGILSTRDENGITHIRWMTPILIRGRKGVIYAVTPQNSRKVQHILHNPDVTWMIQTRSLSQVINIYGKTNVIENPSLKTELLETVGDRLTMFWKINEEIDEFVVLETVIEKASNYEPLKGSSYTIQF